MPVVAMSPRAPRRSMKRPCAGRATPPAIDTAPTTAPASAREPWWPRMTRMTPMAPAP